MADSFLSEPPVLKGRSRVLPAVVASLPGAAVAVGAFVVVGGLAGADGGYYPTTWGWAGTSLAWLAATALALRSRVSFSGIGLLFLAGLGALLAWTTLSAAWSASPTRTLLEAQRTLLYVAAALAVLAIVRRRTTGVLLGGILAAIGATCVYALGTRMTPERFDLPETVAGYRLAQPIGYWNGLGLLAAIGILLALGFAARGRGLHVRLLAAATLPMLATTMYLTFGRGAWIALGVGLVTAVAVDPRRLQLLAAAAAALPAPAIAVWFASHSTVLTNVSAPDVDAVREGHRLALVVLAATAVAAGLALVQADAERRITVSRATARFATRALVLLLVACVLGVFARFGMPWTIAGSLQAEFNTPPTRVETSLNERLFNLSGSGRTLQWRVARDTYADHRLAGAGAGTYELEWLQRRTVAGKVRDAHSLYLETLAELGLVGFALVLVALGTPLLAIPRARRRRLAPFALGGYVALLAHAAVDWDWELPALTVTGLALGAVLVVAARPEDPPPGTPVIRWSLAAAAVALGTLAFLGLLGNAALADSRSAARQGRWEESAARAREAARWAPWSSQPWRRRALAQPTAKAARPFLLEAVEKDPADWELWLELAWASTGPEREAALRRASELNPLSPEIAAYRRQLAEERKAAAP